MFGWVFNIPYYISLFVMIFFAKRILSFIYSSFFRKRKNLIAEYGDKTWALATGGSDGIGKAFCEELARTGFNIIINISHMTIQPKTYWTLGHCANRQKATNPTRVSKAMQQ